jgi:hypothetical protein
MEPQSLCMFCAAVVHDALHCIESVISSLEFHIPVSTIDFELVLGKLLLERVFRVRTVTSRSS